MRTAAASEPTSSEIWTNRVARASRVVRGDSFDCLTSCYVTAIWADDPQSKRRA